MYRPFAERNSSSGARKTIARLARQSLVDEELVSLLASLTWDYDKLGREARGWVKHREDDPDTQRVLGALAERLGLATDFVLDVETAWRDVVNAHEHMEPERTTRRFFAAVTSKGYAQLSEFSTYHYLGGLAHEEPASLEWPKQPMTLERIARKLFLKFFRGGAMERADLAYAWVDLVLGVPNVSTAPVPDDWLTPLLERVGALPSGSGLKDMLACCKGLVGGDKLFKQRVLQALAYAGVLRVRGCEVVDDFTPRHRDELSPHFYSNEWTYPLRFWSARGGTVDAQSAAALRATMGGFSAA